VDLGFIAALGGDEAPLLGAMSTHPQAALTGLQAGYEFSPHQRLRVARLVVEVGGEDLDTSMLGNERLRQDVDWLIEARKQHRRAQSEAEPECAAVEEPEKTEESGEVPTLSELLGTEASQSDALLLRNAVYFQPQVADLSQGDRRELTRRIDTCWPDSGLAPGIRPGGHGRYSVDWEVQAVLVYGSAVRPPLPNERWAEVAQPPLVYPGREEWLRERYRKAGAVSAAESLTDDGTMAWTRLTETIPGRLPLRVVTAIARKVRKERRRSPRAAAKTPGRRPSRRHPATRPCTGRPRP